jgi:hypothetical protein
MKLLNALKGIGGEFEVQRVLGAFGTIVFTINAPALVWAGKITVSFDGFCLAYPAGIAACIGATAGAIALKDRQTATAKVISETGAVPVAAPAGPRVPTDEVTKP